MRTNDYCFLLTRFGNPLVFQDTFRFPAYKRRALRRVRRVHRLQEMEKVWDAQLVGEEQADAYEDQHDGEDRL